jgi:hypothetical protein
LAVGLGWWCFVCSVRPAGAGEEVAGLVTVPHPLAPGGCVESAGTIRPELPLDPMCGGRWRMGSTLGQHVGAN